MRPDVPLRWFFALTCAWAGAFWAAAAAAPVAALRLPLFLIGTFAPAIVALGLTARARGGAGARALVSRIIQGRVSARWIVFALGYLAAIKLAAALAHRMITGAWPRFGEMSWLLVPAAILISTPTQAGEELGWRGYALPRLAERLGLGRASLLLGVIWAAWHLPLFFIAGTDNFGQSFPLYLLQVTALSVAMAWLFGHTRGSLLIVMLMHAAVNNTREIVPSSVAGATNPLALSPSLVAWLTAVMLWIGAGGFLLRMPRWDPAWSDAASASREPPARR